jgi:hypothetical protein
MLNQNKSRLVKTLQIQKGPKPKGSLPLGIGAWQLSGFCWSWDDLSEAWNQLRQLPPSLCQPGCECLRDVMIANPVQPFKATIKYSILWLVQFRLFTKCFCGSNVTAKIRSHPASEPLVWQFHFWQTQGAGTHAACGGWSSRYSGRSRLIRLAKQFCSLSDAPLTLHLTGPDGTLMCCMSLLTFSVQQKWQMWHRPARTPERCLEHPLARPFFDIRTPVSLCATSLSVGALTRNAGLAKSHGVQHRESSYHNRGSQLLFTWNLSTWYLFHIQPPKGIWQHTHTGPHTHTEMSDIDCHNLPWLSQKCGVKKRQFKHRIKSV